MLFLLALSTTLQSPEAMDMAVDLAAQKGAKLVVLFVLDSNVPDTIFERLTDMGFIGEKPSQELQEAVASEYREQADRQLGEIKLAASDRGVPCDTFIDQGDFVERTLRGVTRFAADLLIISRTRRSALSRLFMGSAVDKLIRQAPCEIKVFES